MRILARRQGRKKEKTMSRNIISVDVSQEKLDVYFANNNEYKIVKNEPKAIKKLVRLFKKWNADLIVFEPTNVYHRPLQVICQAEAVSYAVVDSYCVKRHKDSLRKMAKTDKQDAYYLADYAKKHDIQPQTISHKNLHEMQELMGKYSELVEMRIQTKNRDNVNTLEASHKINEELLRFLNESMDKILQEMQKIVENDEELTRRYRIMVSVPGIGDITAYMLLAFVFELGSLNQRQIARLAGLAPMDYQSGKYIGKKFISGGRSKVRKALYMPALSAVRKIGFIQETYKRISQNKPKKVAITACMRKLLVLVNLLVKENRAFNSNY